MAGNGALDLSIRIMGKVDPSLARSISQVKGLTGSLTDGLKSTNSLAGTVAKTLGVVGKTGLALGATLTGSVLVGVKQVTNEAAKLEAQMAPVMRYVDGLADASGKASNAMAQNGKTFAQNYADMKNYIQDLRSYRSFTSCSITFRVCRAVVLIATFSAAGVLSASTPRARATCSSSIDSVVLEAS